MMSKCDHGSGDKFKTVVTVCDYDGMGTELTLRQCDYCKAFSVRLYRIEGKWCSVEVFETEGKR